MATTANARLQRGKDLYRQLRLEEACLTFREAFEETPVENYPASSEFYSLYIRTLYELGKDEELELQRKKIQSISEGNRSPELGYQIAMSYLSQDSEKVEISKKIFEKLLNRTEDVNLLARIKMGLATAHDILSGDWKITSSIIESIEEKGLEPYLLDLLGIWRAKVLRDAGQLEEGEQVIVAVLSKVKSHFHWHAYLSAKIVLGGIYLKQNRFEKLIEIIKEVRAYCDKYPLKTITRQIDYLAEQIRGETQKPPLVLEHSYKNSVLRYEDKVLSLTGEKPWQKLLVYFIKEKIVPKKEIIRNIYRREYKPKRDDKVIYGQLNILKRNLLKLGLSEKIIKKEPFGYRWIPEVSEVEGSIE